jgi:epsin
MRAKEVIALLGDPQKIKEERAKAQENRNKYTGVSSNGVSFSSSRAGGGGGVGNKFGGFGSDSFHQCMFFLEI